jgi:uncharacterized protein YqeY
MNLRQRLADEYKEALKAKDEVKKNTVSFARAAIKQFEVDNKIELDDEGIVAVLTKQVKMRKDALSDFEKAGRTDLYEAYNQEISILMDYLPKQLSEEEIEKIVDETVLELNISKDKQNMGRLMGAVMAKVKGVADGNAVRKVIQSKLQ